MVKKRVLDPLPLHDEDALITFLEANNMKAIHAKKIWKGLVHDKAQTIQDIPQLPAAAYDLLPKSFARYTTKVAKKQVSRDGTIKLLVELQDGHQVEAVIMRHQGRNTLCVSSQVGCQMGCTFCATGTMGIIGNLCSGEILEQVAHANEALQLEDPPSLVRNVVFMGMGEPLNNYDAVLKAIRAMTERFNIAPKHITLSTVGIIHRMRQLKRDAPLCRLALSLHAPTQELRKEIVPSSTAYPLDKLMDAMDEHLKDRKANDMVLIEYVMLKGVNDSIETAHSLGKLLHNKAVHVNLIPYNSTEVDAQYESPPKDEIREFHSVLREQYGLKATVRENHGQDIDGACGQLAINSIKKAPRKPKSKDIEDLMGPKGSRSKKEATSSDIADSTNAVSKIVNDWMATLRKNDWQQNLLVAGASVVAGAVAVALVRRGLRS